MTYVTSGLFGLEVRCHPGETELPTDCERHREHYWCATCAGYYGVPHDGGMHEGPFAHPNQFSGWRDCVCRMCMNRRAGITQRGDL
jgi:hypothetical protein